MQGFLGLISRFLCNVWDKRHLHRWWRPITVKFADRMTYLKVPVDINAGTKESDPLWREHQPWVLLSSTGNHILCTPVFFKVDDKDEVKTAMRPWFRVRTRLFAMRIGGEPFQVITFDSFGQSHVPEIIHDNGKPVIGDEKMIKSLCKKLGRRVTFI